MSKEKEYPQDVPRQENIPMSYPSPQAMAPPMPQPTSYPTPYPTAYPAAYPAPYPTAPPQTGQVPPDQMPPVSQVPLGPEPCVVTCPTCHATVRSNVQAEPGMQTHIIALLLCLICICCTCIPYLVDACQNVVHRCGNCGAYLGTFKR
ncbi:hypothetical protein PYW07_015867 [Mythimna separata]|uniref:LITAF domain-containing protein n=1 Tax=Mythimna separata TaxID=271217 RepID=A0AAD7YQ41_MYTSE|nr:hypothetical protein PYW07_015867 [Mythimna separata]